MPQSIFKRAFNYCHVRICYLFRIPYNGCRIIAIHKPTTDRKTNEAYARSRFHSCNGFFRQWIQCQRNLENGTYKRIPSHFKKFAYNGDHVQPGDIFWHAGEDWFLDKSDNSVWVLQHPEERFEGRFYQIYEHEYHKSSSPFESISTFESYCQGNEYALSYIKELHLNINNENYSPPYG